MPARISEESLTAIEKAVAQHPEGAGFGDIAEALPERLADRTLQYRLRYLVDKGRLVREGEGRRWTKLEQKEWIDHSSEGPCDLCFASLVGMLTPLFSRFFP